MNTQRGNVLTVIIIILAIIGVALWIFARRSEIELSSTATSTPLATSQPRAVINGKEIELIVADTPEKREVGLGGRESLPENTAMVFVFEKPDIHAFWMKGMKFPIDIIWLDGQFKVIHIEANITPDTYVSDEEYESFQPPQESLYVLEGNALFAQKNNLKVGDVVEVRLKR